MLVIYYKTQDLIFIYSSGLRSKDLKTAAQKSGLKVMHFPPLFEVRWTEFTHALLVSVLQSWRTLVSYFKTRSQWDGNKNKDRATCQGYLKTLKSVDKLKLLCVFCDLAYLYKRFQKHLQGDDIALYDLKVACDAFEKSVQDLKTKTLLGGWEEAIDRNPVTDANTGSFSLFGMKMTAECSRRTREHNKFVADKREFAAIRNDALETIENVVQQRLDASEFEDLLLLERFDTDATDDQLRLCHGKKCPDLPLVDFAASYREVSSDPRLSQKRCVDHLTFLAGTPTWRSLFVAISRVAAAKPSSADVEPLISYYNLIKTSHRSSMHQETMKDYLYVRFNVLSVQV